MIDCGLHAFSNIGNSRGTTMAYYTLENHSIYILMTGGIKTHSSMQRCSDSMTGMYSSMDSQTKNQLHLLMLELLRYLPTKTELNFGTVTCLSWLARVG